MYEVRLQGVLSSKRCKTQIKIYEHMWTLGKKLELPYNGSDFQKIGDIP